MQAILTIAIIVVCVLLILVVLVQNSKGGGISSNFSAANQIMGARRGTDFIEKATWTLAILLLVFSLLSSPKQADTTESADEASSTKEMAQSAPVAPSAPAAAQQKQAVGSAAAQTPTN